MTFDNDICRIRFLNGESKDYACRDLGLEWPPPEFISFAGFPFKRLQYSAITDQERQRIEDDAHGVVVRGAIYSPVE